MYYWFLPGNFCRLQKFKLVSYTIKWEYSPYNYLLNIWRWRLCHFVYI